MTEEEKSNLENRRKPRKKAEEQEATEPPFEWKKFAGRRQKEKPRITPFPKKAVEKQASQEETVKL